MVRNFKQQGARHYQGMAQRAAQRYRVDSALILAIMETESSFNPFAVSPSGAYGLMQVMQATAGKDVYEKIYRKDGKPSRIFCSTHKTTSTQAQPIWPSCAISICAAFATHSRKSTA